MESPNPSISSANTEQEEDSKKHQKAEIRIGVEEERGTQEEKVQAPENANIEETSEENAKAIEKEEAKDAETGQEGEGERTKSQGKDALVQDAETNTQRKNGPVPIVPATPEALAALTAAGLYSGQQPMLTAQRTTASQQRGDILTRAEQLKRRADGNYYNGFLKRPCICGRGLYCRDIWKMWASSVDEQHGTVQVNKKLDENSRKKSANCRDIRRTPFIEISQYTVMERSSFHSFRNFKRLVYFAHLDFRPGGENVAVELTPQARREMAMSRVGADKTKKYICAHHFPREFLREDGKGLIADAITWQQALDTGLAPSKISEADRFMTHKDHKYYGQYVVPPVVPWQDLVDEFIAAGGRLKDRSHLKRNRSITASALAEESKLNKKSEFQILVEKIKKSPEAFARDFQNLEETIFQLRAERDKAIAERFEMQKEYEKTQHVFEQVHSLVYWHNAANPVPDMLKKDMKPVGARSLFSQPVCNSVPIYHTQNSATGSTLNTGVDKEGSATDETQADCAADTGADEGELDTTAIDTIGTKGPAPVNQTVDNVDNEQNGDPTKSTRKNDSDRDKSSTPNSGTNSNGPASAKTNALQLETVKRFAAVPVPDPPPDVAQHFANAASVQMYTNASVPVACGAPIPPQMHVVWPPAAPHPVQTFHPTSTAQGAAPSAIHPYAHQAMAPWPAQYPTPVYNVAAPSGSYDQGQTGSSKKSSGAASNKKRRP